MCLQRISKKIFYFIFLFLFVVFLIPNQVKGSQNILSSQISKYFFKINNFTSKFIQSDSDGIQEGDIYLSNKVKRIKIHYNKPSNIVFVLKNNKAMYFNVDLEEVEYFDPRKTIAKIIFEIFNDNMIENFDKYVVNENICKFYIDLNHDDIEYFIEIVFELKPLQLRLVNISSEEENLSFGLRDHNFNNVFDKNFFSMANPLLK